MAIEVSSWGVVLDPRGMEFCWKGILGKRDHVAVMCDEVI